MSGCSFFYHVWSFSAVTDLLCAVRTRFLILSVSELDLGTDPNLGNGDRLQARLSATAKVAHHFDAVSAAAKVWVDPVGACQKEPGEKNLD